tara:strand:+ start:640 stop:948 length:309 start_codon:yes stop_codon:yes gene_type:complete
MTSLHRSISRNIQPNVIYSDRDNNNINNYIILLYYAFGSVILILLKINITIILMINGGSFLIWLIASKCYKRNNIPIAYSEPIVIEYINNPTVYCVHAREIN